MTVKTVTELETEVKVPKTSEEPPQDVESEARVQAGRFYSVEPHIFQATDIDELSDGYVVTLVFG